VAIVAEDVRLVDRSTITLGVVHALSDLVVAKRVVGDLGVAVFGLRLAQCLRVEGINLVSPNCGAALRARLSPAGTRPRQWLLLAPSPPPPSGAWGRRWPKAG
jgi:hypothetical protein